MLNLFNAVATLVVVLVTTDLTISTEDYCSAKLCPAGAKHTCCSSNNTTSTCPENAIIIKTDAAMKAYILEMHNKVRRELSEGKYEGFEPANRMIEMVTR